MFTRSFEGHARPRLVDRSCGASRLLGLVGLGTQARGGRAAEVAAERGSQEGAEDDFGTPIALLDEISGAMTVIREHWTYLKVGRASHSRKTNLKV